KKPPSSEDDFHLPGNVLLSQGRTLTTIGAREHHLRAGDGNGCDLIAIATRTRRAPWREAHYVSLSPDALIDLVLLTLGLLCIYCVSLVTSVELKSTKKPPSSEDDFHLPGNVLLSQGRTLTTIGAEELNFRVRDGNGCDLFAIATRHKREFHSLKTR